MNYYGEWDPKAAAWLRELIAQGLIPAGEVDTRSITEVRATDLVGFAQCHFFAGIGGWSEALRIARWPADRAIWTGSAPCQPFSCAGKGKGHADERHLWPEMFRLVRECRPSVVIGEQVESAVRHGWLDGVFADLEGADYACGAVVLGAHSAGAPHIRQRLFWVADAQGMQRDGREREGDQAGSAGFADGSRMGDTQGERCGETGIDREQPEERIAGAGCGLEHTIEQGLEGHAGNGNDRHEPGRERASETRSASSASAVGERLGDSESHDQRREWQSGESHGRQGAVGGPMPWSDYEIIQCRDGKSRRIPRQPQPGIQRVADGIPAAVDLGGAETGFPLAWQDVPGPKGRRGKIKNRAMMLKGFGNAINPYVAAKFIKAALPD